MLFSRSALLAVPDTLLRQGIKRALCAAGAKCLGSTGNLMTAANAVASGGLDLLVCDLDIAEGDMCRLVREVREEKIGDNPFVVIILLVNKHDDFAVKKAVNCGADDVLLKPFDPEVILERLLMIKEHRPHFVATSSYIGPDRRSASRQNDPNDRWGVKPFLVPNPLNQNISNFQIRDRIQDRSRRSILAAKRVMDEQRVSVSAVMLGDVIQSLLAGCVEDKPLSADLMKSLERLNELANDIFMRASNTPYAHAGSICKMLAGMTGDMLTRHDAAFDDGSLTLISKIPGLLARFFNIKEQEVSSEQANVDKIMASN